ESSRRDRLHALRYLCGDRNARAGGEDEQTERERQRSHDYWSVCVIPTAMNAGPVREQPHQATPPRKSRAAGTPGVLAEWHLSRPTAAPRPAAGSNAAAALGCLGAARSRPPASPSLYIS